MASGDDPSRELASIALWALVGRVTPRLGEDERRVWSTAIVPFISERSEGHETWSSCQWAVDDSPVPARVFHWAGAWGGFLATEEVGIVVAAGGGFNPEGLSLTRLANPDDYHFQLDAPSEWPALLQASQSVALSGKAPPRRRHWPRHADHQELLSRTEPRRSQTSLSTRKAQTAGVSAKTPQFRWTEMTEVDFRALREFAGHAVALPDPWPDDLSRPVFLVPEDSEHFGWSVKCDEIYMDFRPRGLRLPPLSQEEALDGFGYPATIGTRPFTTISREPPPPRAVRPEPPQYPVLAVTYPDGTLQINGFRITRARLVQIGRSLKMFDLAPGWL